MYIITVNVSFSHIRLTYFNSYFPNIKHHLNNISFSPWWYRHLTRSIYKLENAIEIL